MKKSQDSGISGRRCVVARSLRFSPSQSRLPALLVTLSLMVYAVGCATLPKPTKPKPLPMPDYRYQEEVRPELAKRMPWEQWQPFQDLDGRPLTNRQVILGDELLAQGKRRSALDAYLSASSEQLSEREGEAVVLRIASQQLALDNPKDALTSVGSLFKRRGAAESDVSVPFALVLAFAYGRHGDIDQSLAWFSKVAIQGRTGTPAGQVAGTGVAFLLRTLSEIDFERVGVKWQGDSFVNQHVGRERLRRAAVTYDPDDYRSDKPFWQWFDTPVISSNGTATSGSAQVGLIVSLSDRFAALGRDTRQGFELAVEAASQGESKPKLQVRDVGIDSSAASAAVRELVEGAGVSVVAGPLLTEPSVAAAQTAREIGVPLVSFSKSESFQTGRGVFRLGATSSSQMQALVNAAFGHYGMSRFAAVYPQTASGVELLEEFRKKIGSAGLTLSTEIGYVSSDDTSLIDVVQQLESSDAEAVLIADNIEVSEKILRHFSPALRKRMRPLGSALWDNAQKIARSQALFERSVFVSPFFAQSNREEVQKFIESYRSKYAVTPNFLAAQGFDAATLILNALTGSPRESASFESTLVQAAPYQGVTGVMTVEPSGEINRGFYVVEVLKDSFLEKASQVSATRSSIRDAAMPFATSSSQMSVLEPDQRVESGY